MEYKRFGNNIVVRMDRGEDIVEQVKVLAEREQIRLASVQALGAVTDVTVGVVNPEPTGEGAHRGPGPEELRARAGSSDPMACALFISGGLGNIIDRLRLGYVVDMFNFQFMSYPVFNVADICVVCGAFMGAAYYLWFYEKYDKKGGQHGDIDAPTE